MNLPLPKSFSEIAFGVLALVGIIFAFISFSQSKRPYAIRMSGIFFLFALAVVANSFWTYFAAIFILATLVTELEFLQNLAAIIRGDKNYFDYRKAAQGQTTKETATSTANFSKSKRTLMEYMILNTLWTKQVNKWPDLSMYFTFTMNFVAPSERQAFREAGAKLIGEGLIAESDNGQYLLTIEGFDYCKKHYKEFPPEQWWPEESINLENLKKVVGAENI
jgi:hypothetical protein